MNPVDNENQITLFGKTNFRNREVAFGIKRDDRRRHMYVIGKTGMGKTTMIENMVIQDIINGEGVAFVDPHGDSIEKVLKYIPSNRINDVVYVNPADTDFPIAFNPLEAVDPKYKHLVASGLMGVFTKIWAGVWSPRMEYILNNTILALLDSPGNTMLGIARMLVNKTYRKRIIDNIKDPVVRSFWVDEFANYSDKFRTEAIAPIQNKVGQFLSSAIIRNIVGQTKSSIDLRDIMDNRKILLLNLSKGRIGEDSSALLGAMIITKLQLAAMSRVDEPEEERKDFYLYVDEFQNFATESFANILSEARKYRLNLIVAHQYINQLSNDRNTVVRDAIFGNVGTIVCFRVGADDAEFLEKEFEPTYTLNDLLNLAKWSIYLKLMINGVSSKPFSAATLPPISEPTGNADKVITVSRERYGSARDNVELKISKWLGAEYHNQAAEAESDSMDQDGAEDIRRFADKPASKPVRAEASPVAAPAPATRPQAPAKVEKPKFEERRRQERRIRQTENHPQRRASDKKKPKNANPVWNVVSQISSDRRTQSLEKATDALESLSQTIEKSFSQQPAPQTEQRNSDKRAEDKTQRRSEPERKPDPRPAVQEQSSLRLESQPEPKVEPDSTTLEEIELDPKEFQPPHQNIQSSLTNTEHKDHPAVGEALKKVPKISKLKPGEKIKF